MVLTHVLLVMSCRICSEPLGRGLVLWLPVPEWPQPHDDPALLKAARELPRHRGDGQKLPERKQLGGGDEGRQLGWLQS